MILETLRVLVFGMLGIFVVMGMIILVINLLELIFNKPTAPKGTDAKESSKE